MKILWSTFYSFTFLPAEQFEFWKNVNTQYSTNSEELLVNYWRSILHCCHRLLRYMAAQHQRASTASTACTFKPQSSNLLSPMTHWAETCLDFCVPFCNLGWVWPRPSWYSRPNPEDRINRKPKDRIHIIWPLIYPLRYSYLTPNILKRYEKDH